MKLTEDNLAEVEEFINHGEKIVTKPGRRTRRGVVIHTVAGDMTLSWGDWVVREGDDRFHTCKPDVFAKYFEPVEDQ